MIFTLFFKLEFLRLVIFIFFFRLIDDILLIIWQILIFLRNYFILFLIDFIFLLSALFFIKNFRT